MGEIKVRKIGNSLGALFPKEWNLKNGDVIHFRKGGYQIILDMTELNKVHDRRLTEESFEDFDTPRYFTHEEMEKKYEKYDWRS